jgi:hypothetical protein
VETPAGLNVEVLGAELNFPGLDLGFGD